MIEKIHRQNPNIEILEKINSTKDKVAVRCNIDGHVWHPLVTNLLKGQGCPACSKRIILSPEDFKQRVEEVLPDIEIIGDYTRTSNRVAVRCRLCGHTWSPLAHSLLKGHGCAACAGKKKLTTEEVRAQLAAMRPDVELIGEYEKPHKPTLFRFRECGHEVMMATAHVKSGRSCPECGKLHRNISLRTGKEKLQEELDRSFSHIEVVGEYVNTNTPILFRCRRCGYEWEARPSDVKHSSGCPNCHRSGTSFVQEFVCTFLAHSFPEGAVLSRDRTAIGKELDVYVPSARLAVEVGAWHWHHDKLDKDQEKRRLCGEAGIDLVTLYFKCDEAEPPFPGAMVTRSELSAADHFDELVDISYAILAKAGVTKRYSEEEIEVILSEAHRSLRGVTAELFVEEVSQVNPDITVLGQFRGENSTIRVRCNTCQYEWNPVAHRLRTPASCPRCTGHYHWTQEVFERELSKKHPHMVVFGRYVNQNTRLLVRCTKRATEREYFPGYLLSQHCCRQCAGTGEAEG